MLTWLFFVKKKNHLTDTWLDRRRVLNNTCVTVNCQVCQIVTPSYHKTESGTSKGTSKLFALSNNNF